MSIKTTFILQNLSEQFYAGGVLAPGLLNMTPLEQYLYLCDKARRKELQITQKIGHADSFRDRVELNSASRNGVTVLSGKVEPRRGYKLATFEVAV